MNELQKAKEVFEEFYGDARHEPSVIYTYIEELEKSNIEMIEVLKKVQEYQQKYLDDRSEKLKSMIVLINQIDIKSIIEANGA